MTNQDKATKELIASLRARIAALESAGDAMADLLYPEETAKAWRKLREEG